MKKGGTEMKEKEKKEKRLEIVETQSIGFDALYVVADKKTGVQYMVLSSGGITPLLDENGKVYVEK